MPILELTINERDGAQVPVYIRHHTEPKVSEGILALIDTGASKSSLDPSIVKQLELAPGSDTTVQTPTTKGEGEPVSQVKCNVIIPGPGMEMEIFSLTVMETPLLSQGFQMILGRDVLSKCVVVWNGPGNRATLTY